jgi:hypothetical protein
MVRTRGLFTMAVGSWPSLRRASGDLSVAVEHTDMRIYRRAVFRRGPWVIHIYSKEDRRVVLGISEQSTLRVWQYQLFAAMARAGRAVRSNAARELC